MRIFLSQYRYPLVLGLLGPVLTLMVLFILETNILKKQPPPLHTTAFEAVPSQKNQRVQKPKQTPKRKQSAQLDLPKFDTGLLGQSFGLPQFELDFKDLASSGLKDLSKVVMTEETVDVLPRPKKRGEFQYPQWARDKGISGQVVLGLLINQFGQIESIKKISSTPEGVFDQVAMAYLKSWEFEPAQFQGNSVRVWAIQKVTFKLN